MNVHIRYPSYAVDDDRPTARGSVSKPKPSGTVIEIVKDKIASGIYELLVLLTIQMVHSLQERRMFASNHTQLATAQCCYHLQLRGAPTHRTASGDLWHACLLWHIRPLCSLQPKVTLSKE